MFWSQWRCVIGRWNLDDALPVTGRNMPNATFNVDIRMTPRHWLAISQWRTAKSVISMTHPMTFGCTSEMSCMLDKCMGFVDKVRNLLRLYTEQRDMYTTQLSSGGNRNWAMAIAQQHCWAQSHGIVPKQSLFGNLAIFQVQVMHTNKLCIQLHIG